MSPSPESSPERGPDETEKSKGTFSDIEFMVNAVMSPSQNSALKISMPRNWKLDPNSTTQPTAWFSPDGGSAIMVFTMAAGTRMNVLTHPTKQIAKSGGEITDQTTGTDQTVDGTSIDFLKLSVKVGPVELYESNGLVRGPDCDYNVKVMHTNQGKGSISPEQKALIDRIWNELELAKRE